MGACIEEKNKMKTTGQIILFVLFLIGGFIGWQYKEQIPFLAETEEADQWGGAGDNAVDVITAFVAKKDLPQIVTAVGTVRANESVDITTKVAAKILKLQFTEGAFVEQGTELVFLDANETEAELAESQAELLNSRKLYQRALKLYKTKNVPKARVDLLLSELQIAEAKVSADKARLADFIIRAPFSGILGFREVSVGALVRPADMITTLDDITSLKLDFNLPESYLASLHKEQTFVARSVAFKDRRFLGKVQTISTRIDPVTRSVQVRGRIPNKDGDLKPGMFLSVELQTGLFKDAVLVPEHAVTISTVGHFIYVVVDDVAYRRDVIIGHRLQGWVQIVSGLNGATEVVTEGLQKIKDGQKVKATIEQGSLSLLQDDEGMSQ